MQNHYYSTNKIIKSVFEKEYSEGQSYRIDLRSSAEVLWKKLSSDYRNNKIKRAKEKLTLSFKLDIEELYALNQLSFKRQQKDFPVPKSLFKKIIQGCLDKGQGIVLGMHDDQLRWHAGMFLLWDQHSVYYVCGGTNPELRNSGAGIYIIWKAIEWAKTELEVDTFDFLGSNIKNIAKVWRNFGAEATQYPILEISNSKVFQTLRNLKNR
jgi:lipid II:glycine glycyltransferase (peptidoglycan interpeptide bridge formation enzyme)